MRGKEEWNRPGCSVPSTCVMTPFARLLPLSGSPLLSMPPSSLRRGFQTGLGVFSQGFGWGWECTGWQFTYPDPPPPINARLVHQTPSSPTGTPRQTPNGSSCLSPSNPTTRTICLDLESDHIILPFRESELPCVSTQLNTSSPAWQTRPSTGLGPYLLSCLLGLLSPLCTLYPDNTEVPVAPTTVHPVISCLCPFVHPESSPFFLCHINSSSWATFLNSALRNTGSERWWIFCSVK